MKISAQSAPKIDSQKLRSQLKLKNFSAQNILKSHHPKTIDLFEKVGINPGKIRAHAAKVLSIGLMTSALFASSPIGNSIIASNTPMSLDTSTISHSIFSELSRDLSSIKFSKDVEMSGELENKIENIIKKDLGLNAKAEYEGNRLNTIYGPIGAEQHLPRYPGDSVEQHTANQRAGITPGKGAWGYFAPSKSAMTPELYEKERYYIAVQTLYLDDWTTRLAYLRDWYKYRKMLVVNPKTGKSVVAVVADSGPALWTGKSFGGSPEVMDALNLHDGRNRGSVLVLFLDDPENKVPLGPVEYNYNSLPDTLKL